MFGRYTPTEKTFLLLDVENGSVGSALVRVSRDAQPKLFGERRVWLPVAASVSGAAMARDVERAAHEALQHAAHVAARLRMHPNTAAMGTVAAGAIFLAPPWGKPNLATGKPDFLDSMASALHKAVDALFGTKSTTYTAAGAAAHGMRVIAPGPCLVCSVTGEVTELLVLDDMGVRGHATVPLGSHALIRTLRTHSGMSEHEARSASRLPFTTPRLREPFRAAGALVAEHIKDAAGDLLGAQSGVTRVQVIGSSGDWFAQALAHDTLAELFPDGGEVRSLRAQHLLPHLAAHAQNPDLPLGLEALFIDGLEGPRLD